MMGKKFIWTKRRELFIRNNWETMSNRELAAHFGVSLTLVRMKCYDMGFKRMEMEYWTKPQVTYLLKNYPRLGDKELAEIFQRKWPKQKGWTCKHIEKKRKYLSIKRTPEMIHAIKEREKAKGTYIRASKKTWATRGEASIGTIRYWKNGYEGKPEPWVKTPTCWRMWTRWKWEKHRGAIAANMCVCFRDGDNRNLKLRNLVLLTKEQRASRTAKVVMGALSDNYVAGILSLRQPEIRTAMRQQKGLIDVKRHQLLLQRTINEKAKN